MLDNLCRIVNRQCRVFFLSALCIILTVYLLLYTFVQPRNSFPEIFKNNDEFKQNSELITLERLSSTRFIITTHSKSTTSVPKDIEAFRSSHFMESRGNGRLGNKMFEFAALLGIAHRHNYTPFIKPGHILNRYFDIKQVSSIKLTNSVGVGEIGAGRYDTKIEKLPHNRNYTLGGFFQSWMYFDDIADTIRKSFQFQKGILDKVRETRKTLNIGDRITVGVHVRRSDMASARELRRGYNVATIDYFKKAFKYYRDHFKDPLFLVVSDDLNWCRTNLKGSDIKLVSTGSPATDLAMLASCNHTIISTGTFGWWGGYLAGGSVLYYSDFPASGSWLLRQYNKTEYYPPSWIGLQ